MKWSPPALAGRRTFQCPSNPTPREPLKQICLGTCHHDQLQATDCRDIRNEKHALLLHEHHYVLSVPHTTYCNCQDLLEQSSTNKNGQVDGLVARTKKVQRTVCTKHWQLVVFTLDWNRKGKVNPIVGSSRGAKPCHPERDVKQSWSTIGTKDS